MIKKRFISMLVLLAAVVTGAVAQNYTITLPSVSNGSVAAKVNDTPVTSAAAGETVSLVATPDAGYRLKTISGVYSETVSETFSSGANTRTGTYFSVSGSNYAYGWRVGNSYTLTISSLSNQNLSQVVLTVGTAPNVSQRNISHLQADHGTLSATGTTQGNTITITGINSPTVTVSAPGSGNAASMWTITQAKIDGLGSVALTLTDTGDDNVKTFTMPSGNVTISAEFESAVVAVNSITLSQTEAAMTVGGETLTLTPTVLPDDATDKSVTWTSSDETVATVTDGVVTAVAAGTATITVTTTDGAKTATCAVTVAAPAASTYTVTLKEGTDDATSWTIAPAEATTTGVEAGTEVKATYGGTKKVKSVKAKKKAAPANVPVESITLNKTATTIQAGQTETLSVSSVTPDDATDQTVTWSSDNEAVATVDADGKVTAVALGTANITATANDGSGVTATCAVTVSKVVTINQSDWGSGYSFTKDGVTVSAAYIDREEGNINEGGTFSTTLGNFTKIVVTSGYCDAYGTGWSGSWSSKTWAGTPASTVSFSGNFQGMGETQTTIVCTIVPKN